MKLKELKEVIYTDLIINDQRSNNNYLDVWKDGEIFKKYEEYEVVGLRAVNTNSGVGLYLVVSVR